MKLRPSPPPSQKFFVIDCDGQLVTHVYRNKRYLCIFSETSEAKRIMRELDIENTGKIMWVSWAKVKPFYFKAFDGVVLNYSIDSPHVEFLLFEDFDKLVK